MTKINIKCCGFNGLSDTKEIPVKIDANNFGSINHSDRLIFESEDDAKTIYSIFYSSDFTKNLMNEIEEYKKHQDVNFKKFIKLEQENERLQKLISYYENLDLLLE